MNAKNFILTVVVVWIVYSVLMYILHGLILPWENVPSMKADCGLLFLHYIGGLIFAIMFCFIFAKGYEGKGIAEGLRYGLYIGLLMDAPLLFTYLAYFDYPAAIVWFQPIGQLIVAMILGIITAAIYKPQQAASTA